MASLKRFTKTTPTGTLVTYWELSGAGTDAVNGKYYALAEQYNNATAYKHETNEYYLFNNSSSVVEYGKWEPKINTVLSDSGDFCYRSNSINLTDTSFSAMTYVDNKAVSPGPSGAIGSEYSGAAEALFTVASGKADAVVSVVLNGGTNGGSVTLHSNNGTADFATQTVTLEANENIVLDYKQFLQAGDSYKVSSTSTGIMVTANVYEKDQA